MTKESLLKGKRILIVDDEPDVLDTLEELLKGCLVTRASSFNAAREMLETETFDLAILDIMGVDGYALLDIANSKKIPAVMLTAHAFTPDNLLKSMKEGAASYLPKEEMTGIAEFLIQLFEAREKDLSPWSPWEKKFPSSYFSTRFGAAWKSADKEFLDRLREVLKERNSTNP